MQIQGACFPGCFLVLRDCSEQLILGLDVLHEYGAIINLRELLVTFFTQTAAKSEEESLRLALRVCNEYVTMPPLASVFVTVECEGDATCGIVEDNVFLLLQRQGCVHRGLVDIRDHRTQILITNFSNVPQGLTKKTAVTNPDDVYDFAGQFASFEVETDGLQPNTSPPTSPAVSHSAIKIEINPNLNTEQKHRLQTIIDSYGVSGTASLLHRR